MNKAKQKIKKVDSTKQIKKRKDKLDDFIQICHNCGKEYYDILGIGHCGKCFYENWNEGK